MHVVLVSPRSTLAERFWSKVRKTNGCWAWTGSKDKDGYGQIGKDGGHNGHLQAHRVSWELHYGPIPAGLQVLHHCDHPQCTNPRCLFLGTPADNARDKAQKGRAGAARGEKNPNAKITEAEVREIRRAYATGKHTQEVLGLLFGVSQTRINDIVRGKGWAHVEGRS